MGLTGNNSVLHRPNAFSSIPSDIGMLYTASYVANELNSSTGEIKGYFEVI